MIICVGSVFLDHIVKINTFPKKPIKVLAQGIEKRLGGSAAVASFTIKKLGINTSFIGRLGNDDASKFLKNELKKFKIKHNNIVILSPNSLLSEVITNLSTPCFEDQTVSAKASRLGCLRP